MVFPKPAYGAMAIACSLALVACSADKAPQAPVIAPTELAANAYARLPSLCSGALTDIERRTYLGNAWHLIPEPGADQDVTVRFAPLEARNVAEVVWHKTQRAEFNADGTLDFRVTVSGLREISWWILGYGDQAEVLEPSPLRELIATHAANLVTRYNAVTSVPSH